MTGLVAKRVGGFAIVLALVAMGCPADDEQSEGSDGGTVGEDGSGSASASASSTASSPATTVGDADGSGEGGNGGGPGVCCSECPAGTMAGDSCVSYAGTAPCCTETELFTCDDLQCGSQSCVGTWTANSCTCDVQSAYYGSVLAQAQVCDPADGGATCALSDVLVDACGCAAIVDTSSPALADAIDVQAAWMAAGCGPMGCGAPCITEGTPTCAGDEQYGYYCTLM